MSDWGTRYLIWRYRVAIAKAHRRAARQGARGYPGFSATSMSAIPPMERQLAELKRQLRKPSE
ncbi:hypothetical protein, partial [Frankia tisae]|uniref:hypothetical protein n=1 Tax=Frankia tisae TaxID=2950104 RepID=UPI0021C17C52